MASALRQEADQTLQIAFAAEARRGVRLGVVARAVAFVLLWLGYFEDAQWAWRNPWFQYRSGLIAAALLSGALTLAVVRRVRRPVPWCALLLGIDLVVITLLPFGWLPPAIADYPQFIAVRQQDILLYLVILTAGALPLSARLAGGAALGAAALWLAAVLHAFTTSPGAITSNRAAQGARSWDDLLTRLSKPLVLQTDYLALQVALLLGIGALLVVAVRGGRRLVAEAVAAESARARFARFMPPEVAAAIGARADGSMPSVRRDACILFADFDRSGDPPSLDALQDFYARAERAVFEQGGVIDRFVGDAVMASFGAIGSENDAPAERALRCAERLLEPCAGLAVVVAAVHRGAVIAGEVGSPRQRAFGVVGDTVNVARRLLDWARDHDVRLAVSGPLADKLDPAERARFALHGDASLRGLDVPLPIWVRA